MPSAADPFSLYIHIPFCVSKCPYCDFNSHVVARIPEEEYSAALLKEMEFYAAEKDWQGRRLKSIFFGGGTPSTFGPKSIARVLTHAGSLFRFEENIEITLEANPGAVDRERFSGYRSCGVNRISIGAQSFQPRLLEFLGRTHTADETRQALKEVRRAGFENFNLDLIFAVPGQSLADLKEDLEEAIGFQPPHLAAYNLTIEEGTPFHREFRAGRIQSLPEEEELSMAELIEDLLAKAGLERYEISNYAKNGYPSRHNLNYWQGGDYLGIGAGAHSYKRGRTGKVSGRRWHNERSPGGYIKSTLGSGQALVGEENTDLKTAAGEFMFLGLRMKQGVFIETFSALFGRLPAEFFPEIFRFKEEGFLEESGGCIRLSRRGFMVANSIFVSFV